MNRVESEKNGIMMEEGKEKFENMDSNQQEEIFSKAIRAGKRTYFFDVKATRRSDFYLTITESKKRYHKDGRFFYEKHKIFLYKEDFDKFISGLTEATAYVEQLRTEDANDEVINPEENSQAYTDVDFEDLEKVEATTDENKDE